MKAGHLQARLLLLKNYIILSLRKNTGTHTHPYLSKDAQSPIRIALEPLLWPPVSFGGSLSNALVIPRIFRVGNILFYNSKSLGDFLVDLFGL